MAKPKTNRAASTSRTRGSQPSPGAAGRAFWRFSLRHYRQPGVAAACLRLQDRHGLDVNLLLLCGFAARSGHGPLSRRQIAAAGAMIEPWNSDVLWPLRKVRWALRSAWTRQLAGNAHALRPKVARVELAAEKAVQLALDDWLTRQPRPIGKIDVAACVLRNLECYVGSAGPALDRQGRSDLRLLANAMS